MDKLLRDSVIACAAILLTFPVPAFAQSYPVKPVRVVIPWPAGGSVDIAGRVVMQRAGEFLGQKFVIDNRPGAAGSIGADVVAKAPGDGYTLMVHSTTHLGNAAMYKKLPYDTLKDFVPVALLAQQPGGLVVHPSLPVRSVKEFVALAQSKPGHIFYSSAGNGSAPHLSMAQFIALTGIKIIHVPHKGGPPAVTALIAGETQAMTATLATVVTHLDTGRLRLLGVTGTKRLDLKPDVPTIAEAGVPGYEMSPWIAAFSSGGTSATIVDRLNNEINRALRMEDVSKVLYSQALEAWIASPAEFAARINLDYEKYARLIKASGATID